MLRTKKVKIDQLFPIKTQLRPITETSRGPQVLKPA